MLDSRNIKITRLIKFLDYKNLELYRINKVYDNSIYELKLLISMKRVYSIFYL